MARLLAVSVFVLLMGCATSSVQLLNGEKYPPKPADCQIDVFFSEAKVTKKYKEIALIGYKTGQDLFSKKGSDTIVTNMKEKACKVGADGVILRGLQEGAYGSTGSGDGLAIKYE